MNINLPFLLVSASIAMTACGGGSTDASSGTRVLSSTGVAAEEAPASRQLSRRKAFRNPNATIETTTPPDTTITTATTQLDVRLNCNLPNFEQEILDRINLARANGRTCGSTSFGPAPALRWNGVLFNAASVQSTDMAASNYFSHTSQDGRSPGDRITGAGYAWSAYGENIAAGQTSVQAVVDGWLESPGHCANIMNADFVDMATACVASSTSTYPTYWAMELARPY